MAKHPEPRVPNHCAMTGCVLPREISYCHCGEPWLVEKVVVRDGEHIVRNYWCRKCDRR